MDKERIRTAVLQALQDELDRQTGAALESKAEATSQESKAEHKYDMRAQEAAYLAEGQARQAAEIAAARDAYRALPLPTAPDGPAELGRQLIGRRVGDTVQLPGRGGPILHQVQSVS